MNLPVMLLGYSMLASIFSIVVAQPVLAQAIGDTPKAAAQTQSFILAQDAEPDVEETEVEETEDEEAEDGDADAAAESDGDGEGESVEEAATEEEAV